MSVRLDEVFDESPGLVCVILSMAVESAGWRLMHVSEAGDRLVWEVTENGVQAEVLEAVIAPHGQGARVSVRTVGGVDEATDHVGEPGAGVDDCHRAPVIDLQARMSGRGGFGPPDPRLGPDLG